MKFLSNLRNRLRKSMLKNERGQGATEYILLLVVVVGLVMMFKDKIKGRVDSAIGDLGTKMDSVTAE